MTPHTFALALVIATAPSAGPSSPAPQEQPATAPAACELDARDRAWLERSLEAWRFASREIAGIGKVPSFRAYFFDSHCLLTSENALTSPTAEGVTWSAARHAGEIEAPGEKRVPVGVTSFASGDEELYYFVMTTPSVWEANGIGEGAGLDLLMVSVLVHEASHVAQLGPYGRRLGALIEKHALPDSFNDNAVQERFQSNSEVKLSVKRETKLFLEAAAAQDETEARLLAYEARELMRERQARWSVGADAYLVEAEDVWLTFEGSAQWLAYQWQIHAKGGAREPAEMLQRFARGSQWSQTEGFAAVMALDRIAGPTWKRHAFGDGEKTLLEMLDAALDDS